MICQRVRTLSAGVIVLVFLALTACASPEDPESTTAESAAGSASAADAAGPAYRFKNQAPGVRYIGIDTCKTCHFEIASTYARVGMGRSWYPMSPDVVIEDFTDNNEVVTKTGVHYRMIERDGRYYQRQFLVDSTGKESAVDEREIIQVVGSANHGRTYNTKVGDQLHQMPVSWFSKKGIWDLAPGYQIQNMFFHRPITAECTFCHNGTMIPREGTLNVYDEPIHHGIDCERCHGPGELHVRKWSEGTMPSSGLDDTIVNPRHLDVNLRIEVCYQCHLGGSETGERIEREGRDLYDYRPGLPMLDVVVPFGYEEPLESVYNVTGQVDRFVRSKCYTESDGRFECLTCHNPHVSIYREDRPADYFKTKCMQCHGVEACGESHGAREVRGDDCVSCHMRKAEPTDHPHVELVDHWIRKRIDIDPTEERKNYRFEPLLAGSTDEFTEAELAYYRGRTNFMKTFQTASGSQHRLALRLEAGRLFQQAIDGGYDNARSWYFLGKNLMFNRSPQDYVRAAKAFRRSLQHDAEHRDSIFELASALLELQRPAEAAPLFHKLLDKDPRDPAALADLGRCELALRRPDQALDLFDRALVEDPMRASLHANRGAALAALGRTHKAANAVATAARLDPENVPIWRFYTQVLQQAGRPDEAREAELRVMQLIDQRPAAAGASRP